MNVEFETTGRLCLKHQQPATILCLNKDCKDVACCAECVRTDHPHPRMLMSFAQLAKVLPKSIVDKAKNVPLIMPPLFSRPEFQQNQVSALEILKKRLSEEKKKVYGELDRLEESAEKMNCPKPDIMKHLANYDYFCKLIAPKLIELKVCCANQQGITTFRDRMIQLHLIGEKEYQAVKQYRKIKENTWKRMRALIGDGIAQKVNKIVNYQVAPKLKKREKSLEPERVHPLNISKITNKSQSKSPSPRKKIISCRKL